MGKYFKNIDMIESDDVATLLHRADKKPENFIRIALHPNSMWLDNKTRAEFKIHEAALFIWDIHGRIYRYDFDPGDPQRSFYAAIEPNNFVAYVLDDPKYPQERLCMFDHNEAMMGIFKADTSTIFIIYDGMKDHIGYGFYLEKDGYPSIYEKMMSLLDISQRREDTEHKANDDELQPL